MKTKKLNIQKWVSYLFVILIYAIIYFLPAVLPAHPLDNKDPSFPVKDILMVMGGSSAIHYLLISRTHLSKRMMLLSFFVSTLALFEIHYVHYSYIGLMYFIVSLFIFYIYFEFYFISNEIDINKITFILILIGRVLISPEIAEWERSFLLQLSFLYGFSFVEEKERFLQTKGILFPIILLFILIYCIIFGYYLNPNPHLFSNINVVEILLLVLSGVGALKVFFLTKRYLWLKYYYYLYIISIVFLGLLHNKEEGILPKMTLCIIGSNVIILIFLWMISVIQGEKFSTVILEIKSNLPGIYISLLYLLSSLFLTEDSQALGALIFSLNNQILFLSLLSFILKKEDQDKEDQDKDTQDRDKKDP